MKITNILMMTLAAGMAARADFSYTTTRKSAQSAPGGDQVTKYYLKGQRMVTDTGNSVLIMDFARRQSPESIAHRRVIR